MTYEDDDETLRLLPGYIFDPTDGVLVEFYLKRRVFSQRLPIQIIPDLMFFRLNLGVYQKEVDEKIFYECKFFFYNTMDRDFKNIDKRVAGSGQWRVIEKGKDVPIPGNNEVSGKRNTLNFWEVQESCARRTKWVMHEFRLVLVADPIKVNLEYKNLLTIFILIIKIE
ncbi:NAC domain-containing protein 83-like [Lotus japonicus]|uniref:NAC domain-containing protein 83-like n=1 Tax=Lotus japonicus TaxID=34305 RepID=UPI00258EE021|nr:NAC domain-containing protein 83-like [Lotus japonicus]